MAFVVEELDTEMFIASVKAHPEIWNANCEEYKDRRRRDAAWEKISKEVVENFEERDDKEKDGIIKKLAVRWRNLRDTYAKSEKKRNATGKSARVRQYIYAKHLSFLRTSSGSVAFQPTVPEEEDEESQSLDAPEGGGPPPKIQKTSDLTNRSSEHKQALEHKREINKMNHITPSASASDPNSSKESQHRKELESSLLKFMNQPMSIEPHDADQLFFDSLLPTVRKLDEDQKLDFRAEVLKLLRIIRQGFGSQLQLSARQPHPQTQYHFPTSQNSNSHPYTHQPSAGPSTDSIHQQTSSQFSSSIGSGVSTSMSPPEEILP